MKENNVNNWCVLRLNDSISIAQNIGYLFARELKTFFGGDHFLEKDSQQLFLLQASHFLRMALCIFSKFIIFSL